MKWTLQGLSRAFEGWHAWAAEKSMRSRRLRQAVMRMERAEVWSAFSQWHGQAQESVRLRSAASRVILRMQNASLLGGFERGFEDRNVAVDISHAVGAVDHEE